MRRESLTGPGMITAILILQFVPLLLYPLSSFSTRSQEWWLPALLVIMVIIADIQIMVRKTTSLGPWHLMGFAHGFNIISRLMLLFPHATTTVDNVSVPNWPYIALNLIAIVLSGFVLWFQELPEVRMAYLPK